MFITISDNCVGCGACAVINPEIFEIRANKATANQTKVEGSENDCIEAILNCPVNAIHADIFV